MSEKSLNDKLAPWKTLTPARIHLPRAGNAISTHEVLRFQLAHAMARDAVQQPWNEQTLVEWLKARGERARVLKSQASNQEEYLRRPDLGRLLSSQAMEVLRAESASQSMAVVNGQARPRVAFCVTSGLSAPAIERHFAPFWEIFVPMFTQAIGEAGPCFLIPYGRVAVADPVGQELRAEIVVIFVGERPGLSAPDSMGIYFTYAPRVGRVDAERNCLSNIRPPDGCDYKTAAERLVYLLGQAMQRRLSGVTLKDDWQPAIRAEEPSMRLDAQGDPGRTSST